jgi:hypothetical protein
MNEIFQNLLLFSMILLGLYFFFRNYDMQVNREGLDLMDERKSSSDSIDSSNSSNGIASNSKTYLTTIKDINMKMKDTLNVSNVEYRKNYEDIILNMDDLINYVMLKTMLTIDQTKPESTIIKLSQLNQARSSLNNILKFVDKQ